MTKWLSRGFNTLACWQSQAPHTKLKDEAQKENNESPHSKSRQNLFLGTCWFPTLGLLECFLSLAVSIAVPLVTAVTLIICVAPTLHSASARYLVWIVCLLVSDSFSIPQFKAPTLHPMLTNCCGHKISSERILFLSQIQCLDSR